jgi:NAD(P)-dependent dehydrogenase (short-subunit alcohol dehydrogenase family)
MAFVFVTGSTDGLGRAAAHSLLDQGHRVVLHARTADRAAALGVLAPRSEGVVVGDLQSFAETRSIADQVPSSTTRASTRSETAVRPPMATPACWRLIPSRRIC